MWKSDFDAERDSRERLHAEKSQLENELKQLQLRNQQLLDEMENFSKRQFQEMQQRHANQGFQHSLQQHLRVGQQNHGSPYQPPTYTTQSYPGPAAGAGAVYDNRSTNMTMGQVSLYWSDKIFGHCKTGLTRHLLFVAELLKLNTVHK